MQRHLQFRARTHGRRARCITVRYMSMYALIAAAYFVLQAVRAARLSMPGDLPRIPSLRLSAQ